MLAPTRGPSRTLGLAWPLPERWRTSTSGPMTAYLCPIIECTSALASVPWGAATITTRCMVPATPERLMPSVTAASSAITCAPIHSP